MAAQASDGFSDVLGGGRASTGHTGNRHVVDEAGTALQHTRQTRIVGGRRGQTDEVDAGRLRRGCQLGVVLGWQVNNDQTVNACFLCLRHKGFDTKAVDRVVVTHQHNRRSLIVDTEFADHLQGFLQGLASVQSTQGRQLNRHAVSHRIGERHAQLDYVSTRSRQALQDFQRSVVARVTGGDEGDQRRTTFGFKLGETMF